MADREKLVELLENYPHDYIYKHDLADYLLENGVGLIYSKAETRADTVKEMANRLKENALFKYFTYHGEAALNIDVVAAEMLGEGNGFLDKTGAN